MKRILPASLLMCLIVGCGSDDRLTQMAKEHEARQAEQNLKMAELQKSVADGSKRLVEAEAESRNKLLAMQDKLRADQATVGEQRDKLEGERREIAAATHPRSDHRRSHRSGWALFGLPAAFGVGRLPRLRDEAHRQPGRCHRYRIPRRRSRLRASFTFGTADATTVAAASRRQRGQRQRCKNSD